jgi:hypothetical protein
MLVAIGFAGAANAAYYSLATGLCGGNACSGGQAQIGDGLPLPIQPNKTPTAMQPIGTGTKFPPLLISVNPNPGKRLVKQTGASAPLPMKVPPGVFLRVPTVSKKVGVAQNNPKVFQVRTKISFSGPANVKGTMTFKKNGWRTAPITLPGVPAGKASAFYSGSTNRFGGASQTRIGVLSKIGVWVNPGAMLPCKHTAFGGANASCLAPLVPAYPMTLAAAGGGVATGGGKITMGVVVTTPGGPAAMSPGVVILSIPNTTGLIAKSASAKKTGTLTNMATSVGFPWTTGKITLSQMSALGAYEKFTITGGDARSTMGAGTISLVSGALSNRKLSGPNANKSWARYTLPEPGAALGAAAALAILGICHGLVRRRSR